MGELNPDISTQAYDYIKGVVEMNDIMGKEYSTDSDNPYVCTTFVQEALDLAGINSSDYLPGGQRVVDSVKLLEDKLLIDTGFLSTKQEEIKLYRIMDITLNRSFIQKIFGVGTIHCCSGDKSTPEFDIRDIKKSFEVKEMLSRMVEEQRDKKI